jgi:hypothetical protein
MSSSLLGLLELLLVFALVAWFGISQLRAVRRDRPTDEDRGKDRDG